jgi:hypothetical protein
VIGGWCFVNIKLLNTSGGTAGASANPIFISYPIPASSTVLSMGTGVCYENGGTTGAVICRYGASDTFYFHNASFANILGQDQSSADRYLGFTLAYPIA